MHLHDRAGTLASVCVCVCVCVRDATIHILSVSIYNLPVSRYNDILHDTA